VIVFCDLGRLCVIGLAPSHIAFKDEGGITAVDFNVGKSDRSGVKVTGKRKKVPFYSQFSPSYHSNENTSFYFMLNTYLHAYI
jgi:hypothetical protein